MTHFLLQPANIRHYHIPYLSYSLYPRELLFSLSKRRILGENHTKCQDHARKKKANCMCSFLFEASALWKGSVSGGCRI